MLRTEIQSAGETNTVRQVYFDCQLGTKRQKKRVCNQRTDLQTLKDDLKVRKGQIYGMEKGRSKGQIYREVSFTGF